MPEVVVAQVGEARDKRAVGSEGRDRWLVVAPISRRLRLSIGRRLPVEEPGQLLFDALGLRL